MSIYDVTDPNSGLAAVEISAGLLPIYFFFSAPASF